MKEGCGCRDCLIEGLAEAKSRAEAAEHALADRIAFDKATQAAREKFVLDLEARVEEYRKDASAALGENMRLKAWLRKYDEQCRDGLKVLCPDCGADQGAGHCCCDLEALIGGLTNG